MMGEYIRHGNMSEKIAGETFESKLQTQEPIKQVSEQVITQSGQTLEQEQFRKMSRLNAVWNHPLYQKYYRENEEIERDREFCCHQITHLLDVARIAYIKNLEEGLGLDKEMIYTAAVLHDIGKALQYTQKIPHEIAGKKIAGEILDTLPKEVAFSEEERTWILEAVRGHRRKCDGMSEVAKLFYESDKRSRNCFACPVEAQCNWSEEEKNMEIKI